MKPLWLPLALMTVIPVSLGQDNFPDIADFTRSPSEHVINVVDNPFIVRSVRGVILFKHAQVEPLANVLFEIKGPGTARTIKRATTNKTGKFKIHRAPIGSYRFKATLDGYQPTVGTIIVSTKAERTSVIRIEMRIGE
jgi:hypothetical protein